MDDRDGDNHNDNRYKFGLKVCNEDKCCEFDFKDSENGRIIYPKNFTNSIIEMDASTNFETFNKDFISSTTLTSKRTSVPHGDSKMCVEDF